MKKIKKILESTITKSITVAIIVALVVSGIFCFDFYKRSLFKIKSYYWVYKGDKAYKKHELQNAINYYEYGIKLHPKHYKAMYNLANIYVAYEDYYSALKNYKKALSIKPDYNVARIDYAIILTQTYKTDEAINEYKKVISSEPRLIKIPFLSNDKKVHIHNKGIAYYNMGIAYRTKSLLAGLNEQSRYRYLDKASESYKQASEILKSYNSNYNLGLINQLLQNKNQAGYYYCKAMEISPLEYEAHFNYAILLNDLKDYKGASEEFKKAGLILDANGDNERRKYIYDILSQVNQKIAIVADSKYYEKIKQKEQEEYEHSKYKAGKLLIDDSSEEEIKENFGICENKEIFMGDI